MKLINKNQKIFIAGHKGMAGKAICKSLKNNGYQNVLTVDRSKLDLMKYGDVKDFLSFEKPEVVVIAAAKVGGISANSKYPVDFLLNNLKIQNNLIELSFKEGVKRLLFLGSSCIYPKFSEQPIKEEELLKGYLESSNEWYAIAKISGIKLCQAFRKQYGFDAISLMPNNLYGPGDNYHIENSHVLAAMIRRYIEAKRKNLSKVTCWGTGSPFREFLYSEDLGDACLFALENWDPTSKNAPLDKNGDPLSILNVGTGKDITIKKLSFMISEFVNYEGITEWDHSKPDGTPRKQLDVSRLSKLGWEAKTTLEYGLKKTIAEIDNMEF